MTSENSAQTFLITLFSCAIFLLPSCGEDSIETPTDVVDVGRDVTEPDTSLPPPDVTSGDALDLDFGPLGEDEVGLLVLLDGEPARDIRVMQGGVQDRVWWTDDRGRVVVPIDRSISGKATLIASHPEARIRATELNDGQTASLVELARYKTTDQGTYAFQDAGDPTRPDNSLQCRHCHESLNDDWYDSPHRSAASNPRLWDLYLGAAASLDDAECLAAGGQLWPGLDPVGGERVMRCYLGAGVLPNLNDFCGNTGPCDGIASEFGGCADCHAPAINGTLGGRDLLEVDAIAHDQGVTCDLCHRVDAIDDASLSPGVSGRLKLLRPGERSPSPQLGAVLPLTFGPSHDSPNPRMGNVQRDHFRQAKLCSGCHEQLQPVMVPNASLDSARWPQGLLPIQTTYSEWLAGPMNPSAPCQSCHMPPAPLRLNAADLETPDDTTVGIPGGWARPPGSIRAHSWVGPRQPESGMLQMAAAIFIKKTVAAGTVMAEITVKNVGPGHAIPTGEPMRSLVLLVSATCDGAPLDATGGDAVPDFGGWLDRRDASQPWTEWPGASPGEVIRVIRYRGDFHDYQGYGPFGDGRFDASAKGMPVEEVAGHAVITAVDGDVVTLDRVLPVGDVAYRTGGLDLPAHDAPSLSRAGAPGFAFARVTVGELGQRMVPSFLAVDVASDNRLLPQKSWTSRHEFATTCASPRVRAMLIHRAYPLALARERGWTLRESVMVEVNR